MNEAAILPGEHAIGVLPRRTGGELPFGLDSFRCAFITASVPESRVTTAHPSSFSAV